MNPNSKQALENEAQGVEEEGEDIDYDVVYGGVDVNAPSEKSPEVKDSYRKIFGDVLKQGSKEFLIGAGGIYGDLAELAGIDLSSQLPGQQARNRSEFETLQKMQQPGYEPSFSDIYSLSDEDIAPSGRLPTSQSLREVNDLLGGPGKAKTKAGRYAGRIGNRVGSNAALGVFNPLPGIASGGAGQAVEEFGYGPLEQAAAEIVAALVSPGSSGTSTLSSSKKAVQDKIANLRKLGYADEEITLAINAASKGKVKGINASKGEATENAFKQFKEHSDELVGDILSDSITGYERGPKHVHQLASDAYGEVADKARNLKITKVEPFFDTIDWAIKETRRNLGNGKEAQDFIERLTKAGLEAVEKPNADAFMNFYRELNSVGNWMGRNQKDRIINRVKDSIKDTFRSEGSTGTKLAEQFEAVNAGVRKAYQAEELHHVLNRAMTQEGLDYKKFNKLFDNSSNVDLFKEVLGPTQTENLIKISKVGKEVGDFDKAWKSTHSLTGGVAGELANNLSAKYFFYHGDWASLAKVVGTKIGAKKIKEIAERSLTDPAFQNLWLHALHSIKNGSAKSFRSVNDAMKKYLEKEGLEIGLD